MPDIQESVGMGGSHGCGCKACYTKNGNKGQIFDSFDELKKHQEDMQLKVFGSNICKYCKQPYEYGRHVEINPETGEQIKIIDKPEDLPTAKIVYIGEAMHPECKIKYFEEQGLVVSKK